eukprot:gb/GEZN01021559.1/.p1 GENE.gb/GEZN01021559.1/~~gb/GEZN01021559.1/.p1  ORF type:complete len:148 (+),score=15.85 gb/GEZN01021559.1/:45-488(+)
MLRIKVAIVHQGKFLELDDSPDDSVQSLRQKLATPSAVAIQAQVLLTPSGTSLAMRRLLRDFPELQEFPYLYLFTRENKKYSPGPSDVDAYLDTYRPTLRSLQPSSQLLSHKILGLVMPQTQSEMIQMMHNSRPPTPQALQKKPRRR